MTFFTLAFCLYKPPDEPAEPEVVKRQESNKQQMAFVNGSFRASDYEGSVLGRSDRATNGIPDKTTDL